MSQKIYQILESADSHFHVGDYQHNKAYVLVNGGTDFDFFVSNSDPKKPDRYVRIEYDGKPTKIVIREAKPDPNSGRKVYSIENIDLFREMIPQHLHSIVGIDRIV